MKEITPFANSKLFINHKFKEESPGIFSREETQQPHPQAINAPIEKRTVKFKIYDVDPEYGTNIEFYIDNRLQISGYWINKEDFETTFKL